MPVKTMTKKKSVKAEKTKAKKSFKGPAYMNPALYAPHIEPYEKTISVLTLIGGKQNVKKTYVRFIVPKGQRSSPLVDAMRTITRDSSFYGDEPDMPAERMVTFIHDMENNTRTVGMSALVAFMRQYAKNDITMIENMMREGKITFGCLWYLFVQNAKISIDIDGTKVGGRVKSTNFRSTFFGDVFEVTYTYITTNGRKFFTSEGTARISDFRDTKLMSDLPIKPLSEHEEARLADRGRFYRDTVTKASHLDYTGNMMCKTGWWETPFVGDGRCMIDVQSFRRMKPDEGDFDRDDNDNEIEVIPDDMLYMCEGWIYGFSLKIKRWGRFSLDRLKPVIFNKEAFNSLVLKKNETKQLILALIQNTQFSFKDVIEGKGGGCIMLLYGPPGVGKTLTAESTAEYLARPLYSVSVGELGTDPEALEENLRRILEMATVWGAVVLIDEADIFLEARQDSADIHRNAMVAIFLRMLEYHQGLLYLTTNRVKSFDPAFFSRISVAIRYDEFTDVERLKVWNNLFAFAKIDTSQLDIERLSKHDINGRQIKNAIRIGQSIARSEGVPMDIHHVEKTILHTEQFLRELKAEKEKPQE